MSPRELNEGVAAVGEKMRYKGFHAYQDKGLVTGGDDLLPEKEQDKTPMQKLLERKKLQDQNNGAHFDFEETLAKVNQMKQELKNQQRNNLRTKTMNLSQSPVKLSEIRDNNIDLNSPQMQENGQRI